MLGVAVLIPVTVAAMLTSPEGPWDPEMQPAPALPGPVLVVAPDGDDDGPGDRVRPFQSIARAAQAARPGTTIVVTAGTYPGSIRTTASGTKAAPIVYVAEPRGGARLVGDGVGTALWHNEGDHVEIRGFDMTGSNADGLVSAGSHVRIVGNRVAGFRGGNCITTEVSGYGFHDVDVVANVVHHCGASALDHGIYVGHPRGTVANNISYGNAGYGIHCWHNCNQLTISNNLVFDNRAGGIVVGQGDGPHFGAVAADGFVVSNNIAVDNGGYGIREGGATGAGNRYLHNAVSGNGEEGLDLATGSESGTLTGDPGFVDYRSDGTGDYRLLPTSPLIDAGTAEGAPATDLTGAPRPQGSGVDVGPYER